MGCMCQIVKCSVVTGCASMHHVWLTYNRQNTIEGQRVFYIVKTAEVKLKFCSSV